MISFLVPMAFVAAAIIASLDNNSFLFVLFMYAAVIANLRNRP